MTVTLIHLDAASAALSIAVFRMDTAPAGSASRRATSAYVRYTFVPCQTKNPSMIELKR